MEGVVVGRRKREEEGKGGRSEGEVLYVCSPLYGEPQCIVNPPVLQSPVSPVSLNETLRATDNALPYHEDNIDIRIMLYNAHVLP